MTKKATRKTTKPAENLTVAMEMGVAAHTAKSDGIESLLADLGIPNAPPSDEIVEAAVPGELELEAAVKAAETTEIVAKHYDESDSTETIEGDAPKASTETDADKKKADAAAARAAEKSAKDAVKAADKQKHDEERAAKKAEKDAAAAQKKADREAKKAARELEKANKPVRKYYSSKVERVTDKLGAQLGDYTVLTLSDASLTGDDLTAKQQETLDTLKAAGTKVQNRMTLLLEYVAGKSSKLNEVISRAFALLKKDGFIKTGDKGNFHIDLLAKPYSPAAARAMGNNTVAALRDFKVIQKNEEGVYVANPDSLILMKVNGMLGL